MLWEFSLNCFSRICEVRFAQMRENGPKSGWNADFSRSLFEDDPIETEWNPSLRERLKEKGAACGFAAAGGKHGLRHGEPQECVRPEK